MIEEYIQNIKGLLLQPFDTFERLKSASLTESYRQYVILLILYTILSGIVSVTFMFLSFYDFLVHYASIPIIGSLFAAKIDLFRPLFINWSIFIVYGFFIFLLFAIFLKGLFIHVFVILFGGEQGVTRTFQVLMYAVTPFFLIGWIPYISILGIIWAVVLCIIGLTVLQNIPTWKAVAIILIPTVMVFIGVFCGIMMISNLINVITGLL